MFVLHFESCANVLIIPQNGPLHQLLLRRTIYTVNEFFDLSITGMKEC